MSTTPISSPVSLLAVQSEWSVGSLASLNGRIWYNSGGGSGTFSLPLALSSIAGKFSTNPSYWVNHNRVTDYTTSLPMWSVDQPQSGSGQVYILYGEDLFGGNNYKHVLTTNFPSPYSPKQVMNGGDQIPLFYAGVQDLSSFGLGFLHWFHGAGSFPVLNTPEQILWGV